MSDPVVFLMVLLAIGVPIAVLYRFIILPHLYNAGVERAQRLNRPYFRRLGNYVWAYQPDRRRP